MAPPINVPPLASIRAPPEAAPPVVVPPPGVAPARVAPPDVEFSAPPPPAVSIPPVDSDGSCGVAFDLDSPPHAAPGPKPIDDRIRSKSGSGPTTERRMSRASATSMPVQAAKKCRGRRRMGWHWHTCVGPCDKSIRPQVPVSTLRLCDEPPIQEVDVAKKIGPRESVRALAPVICGEAANGGADLRVWGISRGYVDPEERIDRRRVAQAQVLPARIRPEILVRAADKQRAWCDQRQELVLIDRQLGFCVLIGPQIAGEPVREARGQVVQPLAELAAKQRRAAVARAIGDDRGKALIESARPQRGFYEPGMTEYRDALRVDAVELLERIQRAR